jgi:hypothetical protein
MVTKTVDSRGRITLGTEYAGRQMIICERAGEIVLKPAVSIPENEAWLYANPIAIKAVRTGLQEARRGDFSANPPDLAADEELVSQLAD